MNPFNMSENPFNINNAQTETQQTPFQPQQPQTQTPFQPQQTQTPFQPQQPQQQTQQQPQQQFQPQTSPFQTQPSQPVFEVPQGTIQNQAFGGFSPTPETASFPTANVEEKQQYHIIDLFWFINRKLIYNQKLDQGEAHIMTVGYNASFNNLRMGLLNNTNNAITGTSLIIQNATRLTGWNIYPEEAILLKAYQGSEQAINLRERQIKSGGWSPNQTQITWNKDNVAFRSKESNGTIHCFTLMQEQVIGFEKALEFMYNGTAWTLAMMSNIKK
jgi:hypothetical protein